MKILNLYACLGGNRYKWSNEHQVTAVELDEDLAILYQERFPNDIVIIEDAHQYLLDHYEEFDFIWSSPPCPSHSRARYGNAMAKPIYPDLKLYEEIIFLKTHFKGKFCVENVIPYYAPLIAAQLRGRHLYWANFYIPYNLTNRLSLEMDWCTLEDWCKFHEFDFRRYKGNQRIVKIARNLVDYEAGATILNAAQNIYENINIRQLNLFNEEIPIQ